MSYAIRNTLILLVTLFLIVGLGLSYAKFFLEGKVEDLNSEYAAKQTDFNSKQNINAQFDELNARYQSALAVMENYDKVLFPSNKPDDVFDFLNAVNEVGGNQIIFDFIYSDSLPNNEYGILQSSLAGFGNYKALTEFVNRIENSQLLNKVSGLTISPARQEDYSIVNFSFELESFYERTALFDSVGTDYMVKLDESVSTYNPIFPLIQQSAQPNIDGLPDARSARLIGLTNDRIFIRSQFGRIISLKEGDRVYLGYLAIIDLVNKTATFNLDNGGIQEVVTLEVVR
jgi:Tfp pilus assembly protein PilO